MVDINAVGKDALIMALFHDRPVSGDTSSPLMSPRKNSSVLYVTARRRSVARTSYKLTCDIITLATASQNHAIVILDSVIALHRFSSFKSAYHDIYPLIGLLHPGNTVTALAARTIYRLIYSLHIWSSFSCLE